METKRKNCYRFKITLIVLSFILGEFLIWFIFVRPESFIWLNQKISQGTSPYAISKIDDGRTIISHVVKGFEYILPIGFETQEEPVLVLNYKENGKNICQVISRAIDNKNGIEKLKQEKESYREIGINGTEAMERLPTAEDSSYHLAIGGDGYYIEYSLTAEEENQARCRYFLQQIVKSFRKH